MLPPPMTSPTWQPRLTTCAISPASRETVGMSMP
jgi:hypothetical protein